MPHLKGAQSGFFHVRYQNDTAIAADEGRFPVDFGQGYKPQSYTKDGQFGPGNMIVKEVTLATHTHQGTPHADVCTRLRPLHGTSWAQNSKGCDQNHLPLGFSPKNDQRYSCHAKQTDREYRPDVADARVRPGTPLFAYCSQPSRSRRAAEAGKRDYPTRLEPKLRDDLLKNHKRPVGTNDKSSDEVSEERRAQRQTDSREHAVRKNDRANSDERTHNFRLPAHLRRAR